jgi:hypothetical protein
MSEARPGWNRPKPDVIARPTAWPAGLSLGTMFFAWGIIASSVILVVGLVLFGVCLGGWIGEIRHER